MVGGQDPAQRGRPGRGRVLGAAQFPAEQPQQVVVAIAVGADRGRLRGLQQVCVHQCLQDVLRLLVRQFQGRGGGRRAEIRYGEQAQHAERACLGRARQCVVAGLEPRGHRQLADAQFAEPSLLVP